MASDRFGKAIAGVGNAGWLASAKALIEVAHKRILPHIAQTPCERSEFLNREIEAEVYIKLENLQLSASFKLRGVANKILSLSKADLERQLVAASTGNHGAAFALVLEKFGLSGLLFAPHTISEVKLAWLRQSGIELKLTGEDCVEAEIRARDYAEKHQGILIPPYNDLDIIYGQGTIGLELTQALGRLDAVLIPVGGGGLVSGIGAYLKAVWPRCAIIGCQPVNSAVMYHSIQSGRILEEESMPTLSDGTAGGVEAQSITFEFCKKVVDEFVLLSEEEIASALVWIHRHHQMNIEGAAALSVAAALKYRQRFRHKRIALILSGGRIDPSVIEHLARR